MGRFDDLTSRAEAIALLPVHQAQLAAVVMRGSDLLGQFLDRHAAAATMAQQQDQILRQGGDKTVGRYAHLLRRELVVAQRFGIGVGRAQLAALLRIGIFVIALLAQLVDDEALEV